MKVWNIKWVVISWLHKWRLNTGASINNAQSLTYLCKRDCSSSPGPHWYGEEMWLKSNGFKQNGIRSGKNWRESTNSSPFLLPQCHSAGRKKRLLLRVCVQAVPKWDYVCVCVCKAREGRFSGHPSSCGRAVWHCISGARARPRCSVCANVFVRSYARERKCAATGASTVQPFHHKNTVT